MRGPCDAIQICGRVPFTGGSVNDALRRGKNGESRVTQ